VVQVLRGPAEDPDVDQISLPMRIALAASLVFAALWFVALRPKPVDSAVDGPLPTSPEPTAKAKAKAKAETSTPAKAAAKPKAAKPKPAPVKVSGPAAVLADIKAGRPVVLLFSSLNVKTDDSAVRKALAKADRHGGTVKFHTARMSNLPKYEAITKSVPVTTSPTLLVINKGQARSITGLTTTREIDTAVDAALAAK